MLSRSQTSASGRVEAVFPRLGLFIPQFLHLLTKFWTSWVIPCHHAIILTDASVSFFPGCVSCAFAKTKCRSLGGMKGTTPLKMIPLCEVSASFCCSNPFSESDSFHYVLEESVCSKFSFYFCLGHQITLGEVDVIDCEAHSIVVRFVFVKIHSSQSVCMGYLLSWRVLQFLVKTH